MLTVDLDSPEPLYEQIVRGVRDAIARGLVRVGDRLPSVRQLADDLAVNLNTVARAYRTLESTGLVRIRHGQGVVVVATVETPAGPDARADASAALERGVRKALADARLAGMGAGAVRRMVMRTLEEHERTEERR
ncbi:MAG: hypothetical protein HMLKMBBP_03163 [Planctomycetes bacterium]|nr:hypothetical protein [Planctomycetota bacterium]